MKRGQRVPTTQDATASQQLESARSSPCREPLSVLVRPQPLPFGVGITVAAAFIIIETLLVYWLQQVVSGTVLARRGGRISCLWIPVGRRDNPGQCTCLCLLSSRSGRVDRG